MRAKNEMGRKNEKGKLTKKAVLEAVDSGAATMTALTPRPPVCSLTDTPPRSSQPKQER